MAWSLGHARPTLLSGCQQWVGPGPPAPTGAHPQGKDHVWPVSCRVLLLSSQSPDEGSPSLLGRGEN